jgi:hypothetical protein
MAIKKKKTAVPKFRAGAGLRKQTAGTKKDAATTRKSAKKKTTRRADV